MAIVTEISWDDMWSGKSLPESPARKAFREAVEAVADKARTALPESNGRVDKAVQIVLCGDVSIDSHGEGTIGSQSNGTSAYAVGKGEFCSCKDSPHAAKHLCKHLLSYHIFTRAMALAKQRLEQLDAASHGTTPPTPHQPTTEALVSVSTQEPVATPATPVLPEAPASANVYIMLNGHRVQMTLRDYNEEMLLERMAKILERFPADEPKEDPKPEGWCSKHNAPMKLNHGKRGSWWSHKTVDGQWCNKK